MASTLNLDDEDDFGGDVPGSQSSTKRSDGKRKFGDLDEKEEDVFGRKGKSKIEESGPGMTTGMILSLRQSLQNCKDNLTSCQEELEIAKSEIQKWHSAFHNGPAVGLQGCKHSPTSKTHGKDHGFKRMKNISIGMRPFGESPRTKL